MAIGKNSTDAMMKVHDDARAAYLKGEKGNHFQIMLTAEMFFWRQSNCGLNEVPMFYHNRLVSLRKIATRRRYT